MMKRLVPVTVAAAIFAALIGPHGPFGGFWAPSPMAAHPAGALLVGFLGENMIENFAFGLGIAILLLGRPWFAARTETTARATAAWLAAVWLLASWMPHGALHLHIGMDAHALLPVEWIFHGGAIAAAVTLLWALAHTTRKAPSSDPDPEREFQS